MRAVRLGWIAAGGIAAALLAPIALAQRALPPNVVVILADDMGYGDLGSFGSPTIRTPRLDRMAAEGQKWTSFYVQPVCSPSRAALLTGRLPVRSGMYGAAGGAAPKVLRDNAAQGLPPEEITLAELLKARGYDTAMIGKWHLGHLPQFLPKAQGFDHWFGLPFSHDMRMTTPRDNGYRTAAYYEPKPEYWDVPLMRDGEVVERPVDHRTLTKRYTDDAVRFIGEHRARPFFLYLAHSLPHIPLARSAGFVGHSAAGIYGDVVEELDDSTGRILDALKAAGLERRTLVVFTSDNGPWLPFGAHGGSAGPLREGKGTTWEGGVRTPAIFWWPGTVRPAVVTDIGSSLDVFVTAAKLAGVEPPADRAIDGVDLRPALTGSGRGPRSTNFFYWDNELRAIRNGDYKAHFITSGAYGQGEPRREHNPPLLFNLAVDAGERHNVAAEHPDVVAELTRLADAHRRDTVAGPPLFDALQPAGSRLAAALRQGMTLHYTSNGGDQPPWSIETVETGLPLKAGADCARVAIRRQAGRDPDASVLCLDGNLLYSRESGQGEWIAQRPVGPQMTLELRRPSGDVVRYETGALREETVAGQRLQVVETTVTTSDTSGKLKRRLRERYAVGLATATGGVFEVPDDSAPGGWRPQQTFELKDIRPRQ